MSGNAPASSEKDPVRICRGIRDLFTGRSNAAGSFALTASATTTTVTAPNCGADSEIFLQAKTAHAAAEVGNGTIYISAVAQGQFTVTHASNSQTDRTFAYRIGS